MSFMEKAAPGPMRKNPVRIGCVSYLNAKPLIYGLDEADDIELTLQVPSQLLEGLRSKQFDVALLPIIDYQRMAGLRLIPAGGIGCDGPTLTVRIFSRVPIGQITSLSCDIDSHTSVALAKIILTQVFQIEPQFVDSNVAEPSCPARLMIGDKVVCEEPEGFEYQLDLGEAWKNFAGLPFVFAAWVARSGVSLGNLSKRLTAAKVAGLENVDAIIHQHAEPRGWPAALAKRYLTEYLKFDIDDLQLMAIERFFELAGQHGIVPTPVRQLLMG